MRPYTTSFSVPGNPAHISLLRDLRGAPLSCLQALWIAHPTPVNRDQLMFMTDYAKDKVTEAMKLLCGVYGFAAQLGRITGWMLTTKGLQLKLPFVSEFIANSAPRALIESEKIAFDPSSSSSFISISSSSLQEPTTTTQSESDLIAFAHTSNPLPSEAGDLISKYLRGCKRATAESAVRTALARGDSLADIETEMILWVIYAESPLGKGIRSAAIHAAAKIRNGEKCPDFLFRVNRKDRHDGAMWGAWENANETWLARLHELTGMEIPGRLYATPETVSTAGETTTGIETHGPTAAACADADNDPLPDQHATQIWTAALVELQWQMPKATFDTWVKPTFAISYDESDARLEVGVRNAYGKQWIENRLYGMIERTVNHVLSSHSEPSKPATITFVLKTHAETLCRGE